MGHQLEGSAAVQLADTPERVVAAPPGSLSEIWLRARSTPARQVTSSLMLTPLAWTLDSVEANWAWAESSWEASVARV